MIKKVNFSNFKQIYFVGIGGVGMSAAAIIAKAKGLVVGGSDSGRIYPPTSTILQKARIKHFIGYRQGNLRQFIKNKKAVLVVVGGGESDSNNPEVRMATRLKLPIISFPQLIGELTKDRLNIVVAGAHGKTTTAAMLGWTLQSLGFKPSVWVGGEMKNFSSNTKISSGNYFVMEGDEYKAAYWDNTPKFLYYHPQILILHNLEVDHFDVYKNLAELVVQVKKLVRLVPRHGLILANGDDQNIRTICQFATAPVIYYGLKKNNHFHPRRLGLKNGQSTFTLFAKNRALADLVMPLAGLHNIFNCLPSIILAKEFGSSYQQIGLALKKFKGITRRLEVKGKKRGVIVIDDYAHNPTKVKAALAAVRLQYPLKRIWAVFEPHTYTRTKNTLAALSQSFGNADHVVLSEIYPAREQHLKQLINGRRVLDEVAKYHPYVDLVKNKAEALGYLLKNLRAGDVVVVMSVGSFNKLATELLSKL